MKLLHKILLILLSFSLLLTGCADGNKESNGNTENSGNGGGTENGSTIVFVPERPEGFNFEFWIGEDVTGVDLSDYEPRVNAGTPYQYYALGYNALTDENGEACDPDGYVVFTFLFGLNGTGNAYVKGIEITDPAISVYGITVNSTVEEFRACFGERDYIVEEQSFFGENSWRYKALKGRFVFELEHRNDEKKLTITYNPKIDNEGGKAAYD